ncbi:MAG TPA: ribokinase, partial [Lachnospiraceae bacterium]|nr:ribokinase [Lachnospiraceae bacterium]
KAHALGMTIVLNPSPMNEKVLQLPLDEIDIFLLNEVEAGQILGSHVSEGRALAAALRERFPNATVVLTLGGDGSVCVCSDGTFFQPAYKTHVADTTAAGDTYTGYFLASLLHGSSVADSMKAASAAASIACSRKGAAPSIPAAGEVAAYLDAQGA